MQKDEEVVLVDEHNTVLGTALKATVHTDKTPLHRGFSVFLFNREGKVLLQRRSSHKKTWLLCGREVAVATRT
jgi:isopentenyl-diphosphate delta-isomerase